MSRRLMKRNADGSRAAALSAISGSSGVGALPDWVTINSETVYPTFVYRGGEALAAGTWPAHVGETLSEAGAGTSPTYAVPALGNSDYDEAVGFVGGKYMQAVSTGFGNVGTDDFTALVIGFATGTTSIIAAKRHASVGYTIGVDASDRLYLTIEDAGGAVTVVSAALTAGPMFFARVYVDRSGSAQWYFNGAASGAAVDFSAAALTIDGTDKLTVAASSSGTTPYDAGIVYVGMWHKAAWFATHLNATHAAQEFYTWAGLYPSRATGTAAPTFTRASSAYAQKWNGSSYDLINVGAGIPRVDRVVDASGRTFEGLLAEPEATNRLTYSNDLDTGWTFNEGSAYTGTAVETPVSGVYYQGLIGTAVASVQHRCDLAFTATAATHVLSVIVRKGNQSGAILYNSTAAAGQLFDLDTGGFGATLGTIVDRGIEDLGGGDYLCWVAIDCPAGANTARLLVRTTLNGAYIGDGTTVDMYAAFLQVELGTKPTSRIYTNGATATRAADVLRYNGDNVTASRGAFVGDVMVDDHDPAAELTVAHISDGGSADEAIRLYVDTGTQTPIFSAVDSTVAQWTISGDDDILDGDSHQVRGSWETNDAKLFIDKVVDGTPDTSCTVPTGLDRLDVGCDSAGANQLNGRIRNVQIWPWAEENLG